jgi:hypothetical protein
LTVLVLKIRLRIEKQKRFIQRRSQKFSGRNGDSTLFFSSRNCRWWNSATGDSLISRAQTGKLSV